ncbi:MAG: diguanylate cyclase domain-containing protein [Burkholderiaceae bacterium]
MFNIAGNPFFRKSNLISFAVFAVLVIATELFIDNEIKNLETEKKLDSIAFGQTLQSRVDRELNALLFISGGLSSYIKVYHRELDPAKLNAILADLYANSLHVRNLGIAIGYQMAYIYPIAGNEKALQLNYLKVPEQLRKVQQAIDLREGVLDGPIELFQGGQALVHRYPVFVNNQYWGLISTAINTTSFFQAAFSNVSAERYEFAIRKIDDHGKPGNIIYGDPMLFENKNVEMVINEVPNGKWQWAILNKAQYRIASTTAILRALGWLLSIAAALAVLRILRERKQLAKDALYDDLTGLANRRLLMDRIEQHLLSLERNKDQTCSVILFDLNGFKEINDSYGHHAGDLVLKSVAERVAKEVRSEDTVARLGGDEYVIVLNHETDSPLLDMLKSRLDEAIRWPTDFHGRRLVVGASIGAATYPRDGRTAEELINAADADMYRAKKIRANGESEQAVQQ